MKLKLFLMLAMCAPFFVSAQKNKGKVNDRNGILVFVESKPEIQYRHLGTVECAVFSPDDIDPLIDHMIKQAKKEHEEFDALIFRAGKNLCKADVIQYYRDPKERRKRGRRGEEEPIDPEHQKSVANDRDGKIIFIENSPTSEYKLLGKIEVSPLFKGKKTEEFIKEMLKVANETYDDFDAIVFVDGSSLKKANVIKFKD